MPLAAAKADMISGRAIVLVGVYDEDVKVLDVTIVNSFKLFTMEPGGSAAQ
jgi:hypothetical protein